MKVINPVKPRVLIFSTAYFPFVGGAEVAVKEMTDRLIDYDFDLITARLKFNLPRVEKIGRVTIHRLGLGFSIDKFILLFFGAYVAKKLHSRQPYQLIWAIMASFGGLAATQFKKEFPQIPFLLTLQEGDDLKKLERKTKIITSWFKSIFISADKIQAISRYLSDWALSFGVKIKPEIIPNGVDTLLFTPARNKFILDYKLIITTSRLVYKNGVDILIKAMTLLPVEVRLSIIGDGPLKGELENLVQELALTERVEFVGHLSQSEMLKYLRQADVFVRTSRSEGLGNSFLEAMAVGVPVVGTAVGGIVDFLKNGETGWLVKPEDPSDTARAISFILAKKNQKEVELVKNQAFDLIKSDYTWDKLALRLKVIFDLLIK